MGNPEVRVEPNLENRTRTALQFSDVSWFPGFVDQPGVPASELMA